MLSCAVSTVLLSFMLITLQGIYGHDYGSDCVQDIPHSVGFLPHRENCSTNPITKARVGKLRDVFFENGIDAYIVSTEDAHFRHRSSPHDSRLAAISGFPGSIGIAIITKTRLVLWSDGRAFNAASASLDCEWELYRKGGPGVPTMSSWIKQELGDSVIGSCPTFLSSAWWRNFELSFLKSDIRLQAIEVDLVEQIWTDNRPPESTVTINALPTQFSGRSWQDKVRDTFVEMEKAEVDVLVLSDLDECPWLFNMRAFDFGYRPHFFAYAVIERRQNSARLYLHDHTSILTRSPSDPDVHITIMEHLNTDENGNCKPRTEDNGPDDTGACTVTDDGVKSCSVDTDTCLEVREYDLQAVVDDIRQASSQPQTRKVWVSPYCNHALYSAIPEVKVYQAPTPISITKAVRNPVEIKGMVDSNLVDSAAVIRFFAKLEKEIKQGKDWTVFQAFNDVLNYRKEIPYFRSPAFRTLTGSGPSAAHLYNLPTQERSRKITTKEIFMQDTGGQYINPGTTDLTRSFHYGEPTETEKEIYTRVLMVLADISKLVWPKGRTGHDIDVVARQHLWEIGLDFSHESGHSIGSYGGVTEGPAKISSSMSTFLSDVPLHASIFTHDENKHHFPDPSEIPLEENMFLTCEPGFYQVGKIGVRLENVNRVKSVQGLKFQSTTQCQFLGLEPITLIPFEPNLIIYDMLSLPQLEWLNAYHQTVLEKVVPVLKEFKDEDAIKWVLERTKTVKRGS
ncbi:probable Xaa-Pro aminopeptidase P isoform X1 [Mizuhopecten yessoensis]|uniref:probable Xaa-Pro aminopeptidase P isoform X1 n=1 Tax=Mizuhopecten yessoensis TaxID=6573 RepID=UPI000B45D089|nr:probable Xaa-Pro aminopeptidase P isoform X1 [Mizuhopecten yessoensis]